MRGGIGEALNWALLLELVFVFFRFPVFEPECGQRVFANPDHMYHMHSCLFGVGTMTWRKCFGANSWNPMTGSLVSALKRLSRMGLFKRMGSQCDFPRNRSPSPPPKKKKQSTTRRWQDPFHPFGAAGATPNLGTEGRTTCSLFSKYPLPAHN